MVFLTAAGMGMAALGKHVTGSGSENPIEQYKKTAGLVGQVQKPGDVQGSQINPEVMAAMKARAMGQTPSAADMQQRAAMEQNLQQAQAVARSAPGANPLLAQRQGTSAAMQANLQAQQQGAALRAQEQAGAEQQWAAMSLRETELAQQAAMGNQNAALELENLKLQREQLRANIASGAAQNAQAQSAQIQQAHQGEMKAAASVIQGTAGSDKRFKKKTKEADTDMEQMLDALSAQSWDYKNPEKHGKGRHVGFMAQDAEKSKMGRDLVIDAPDGKYIDLKRTTMAALAAAAHLNKRVRGLEGMKNAK